MLFAKVVVGLPVKGPFDYLVPEALSRIIRPGSRVKVDFGPRKIFGYVVGLSKQSEIKNLKTIIELIDRQPLLDKNLLLLTKELSEYYCCSWGEAIESAIPDGLRKGKKIEIDESSIKPESIAVKIESSPVPKNILIHDLEGRARWDIYLREIKEALSNNLSSLVLLPDIPEALKARNFLSESLGIEVNISYRKQPNEIAEWIALRKGAKVVVGTRSAVFAPLNRLGLIIIDSEEDSVYKQDQVPHYHARNIAMMRVEIEKAKLVIGSMAPSLESYSFARKGKFQYKITERKKGPPEVKLIDTRHLPLYERKKKVIFSRFLEDAIYAAINEESKVLLFLNRKGFATSAVCQTCAKVLKCPRCNVHLVYHFKEGLLGCHYCNFKMETPKICPECNSGYIKFSGTGTEKIESELSRIFPQAKIAIWDDNGDKHASADIVIATSAIIKHAELNFGLIGVLGIDNLLNRSDFRATEKVFAAISGLLGLTDKRILIQTSSPGHHCFQAFLKKDLKFFYDEELAQRKELRFPPFKHLVLVKLRGKSDSRVEESAKELFERFSKGCKNKGVEVLSVNSSVPAKLRGNYCWQILLRSLKVSGICDFMKKNLKDFRHSGIIITIDVDPI